jgi:hypothetical protein
LNAKGAAGPGGPEFAEFQKEAEENHHVVFITSVADLPSVPEGSKRLALISGRTADNPRFLKEAIKVGPQFNVARLLQQVLIAVFYNSIAAGRMHHNLP